MGEGCGWVINGFAQKIMEENMQREFKNITKEELQNSGYRLYMASGPAAYKGIYMKEFNPNGINIDACWYDRTNQPWMDYRHEFIFKADFWMSNGKSFKVVVEDDRTLEEIEALFQLIFKNMNCIGERYDDEP